MNEVPPPLPDNPNLPPPVPQDALPPVPQDAPPPVPQDAPPQQDVSKAPKADKVKQCKNCGSALVFDPKTGCLNCPSCGMSVEWEAPLEDDLIIENELLENFADEVEFEGDEEIEVKCPTCGATSNLPVNEVAGFCPFCKSPIVASSKSARTIRPSGILPFIITSEKAQETFRDWIKSRWFLPNAAKTVCLAKGVDGTYRPTWTFDFSTTCDYTGKRGEYYYETEEYTDSKGNRHTRRVRKTHWYYASGTVRKFFDDLQVYASNRVSRKLQYEVGPWKLLESVNYNEDIVRGFVEESYDVPLSQGLTEAHDRVKELLKDAVKRDIGGDTQIISSMNIHYDKSTYKQLLLPFWNSFYQFKKKNYIYLVNGQTGKGHGERPWSAWKIFFFCLAIAGVLYGLYYLIQNYG